VPTRAREGRRVLLLPGRRSGGLARIESCLLDELTPYLACDPLLIHCSHGLLSVAHTPAGQDPHLPVPLVIGRPIERTADRRLESRRFSGLPSL